MSVNAAAFARAAEKRRRLARTLKVDKPSDADKWSACFPNGQIAARGFESAQEAQDWIDAQALGEGSGPASAG